MRRFTAVAWCRFARQSRPHRTARRTTPIGSEPSRLSIPLPRWRCVASEGCVLVQGRGLLRGENARQITPPGAPLSERVMLWRRISAMFRARCALPQDKYEPYVVLRTGDMTPAYDERFSDYGMNKITHTIEVRGPAHGQRLLMSLFAACRCLSLVLFVLLANSLFAVSLSLSLCLSTHFHGIPPAWMLQLWAAGFRFVVLAHAWAVHLPHAPSRMAARFTHDPMHRLDNRRTRFARPWCRGVLALMHALGRSLVGTAPHLRQPLRLLAGTSSCQLCSGATASTAVHATNRRARSERIL